MSYEIVPLKPEVVCEVNGASNSKTNWPAFQETTPKWKLSNTGLNECTENNLERLMFV